MPQDQLRGPAARSAPWPHQPTASPADWSVLMALAQDGDALAYRQLLVAVTPYVRAIAARAHRNPTDAEDTVQDVLLTLHSARHTYDRTRPFKPWLAGITRFRVADRLRVLGRASAREVALNPWHDGVPAEQTQGGPVLLDQARLHEALDKLPPGQRRAVSLMKLHELSLKEAAVQSGVTVGSLKVAVHRAMATLRTVLARKDGRA